MPCSLDLSKAVLGDVVLALERSSLVSYILDVNLHIVYCNPAWDRFAADNAAPELAGASALGIDLRRVLGGELGPFYLQAFERVAQGGGVRELLYECSSPQAFRKFQMRIHPLARESSYLVSNALVIERAHAAPVTTGLEGYVNSDSLIMMCGHCRCSRRVAPPEQWDFVPAHLERHRTNISHGLCPVCLEYFYPKPDDY